MIRSITKDPVKFNRTCAAAALLFLVLSIGARYAISGSSRQDFSQYYMGGVMARLGAWDSIYPIPKPNTTLNVGYVEGSTMKPRYELEATKRGVGDEPRYIQPPPVALLFVPLSFFTYSQAHAIWIIVLIGCTWAICLQAARMYELCRGELAKPSIVSGILMLLIACSLAAHRWIRVQNVSPIIGAMIGAAAIALVDRRSVRGGLALWLGVIVKYATVALLPVYVVMRRSKALAIFAGVTIASIAITMMIAGRGPFDEYRNVVAPTLTHTSELPQNQAMLGLIARMTNSNPVPRGWEIGVNIARIGVFIALIVLIVARSRAVQIAAPCAMAPCAAFVCWMLIFSPMFWEHYSAYLVPFFGWLAWEATRSRGRLMLVAVAAILASLPTPLFAKRIPDPFKAHLLFAAFIILFLAIQRLSRPPQTADGK